MVEKGIKGGISIYQYAKANNKYMKDYDRKNWRIMIQSEDYDKNLHNFNIGIQINYMGGQCPKSFL